MQAVPIKRWYGLICLAFITPAYAQIEATYFDDLFAPEPEEIQQPDPIQVYRRVVTYTDLATVQSGLTAFYGLTSTVDDKQSAIVYQARTADHAEIDAFIADLDKAPKQIRFDLSIVEVNTREMESYRSLFSSIRSGLPMNYDYTTNRLLPSEPITDIIQAKLENGSAKLVAKPSITGLNNQTSVIHVGDRIPYETAIVDTFGRTTQIDYAETGLTVSIHSKISDTDRILVTIDIEVANVKLWQTLSEGRVPIISKRQTQTQVQLNPNETLIMAGLLDETTQRTRTKVPILGSIPILGLLFRTKSLDTTQTDIIFMLTPSLSGDA